MKKVTLTLAAVMAIFAANAQTLTPATASATQQAKLALANVIDISVVSGGSVSTIAFNTPDDYQNGVVSAPSVLKVRSNNKFRVDVKTGSGFFTKDGSASTMPTSILGIEVSANNTGGSIVNGSTSYAALAPTNLQLIEQGDAGGNQNFTVAYKATPGFTFTGGNYTTDVIYTATQE